MKSLTVLAKYLGCYDKWLAIKQRYNLKWTNPDAAQHSFERLFSTELDFDAILAKIKEMIRVLPASYGAIIKLNCMTGLRPAEAIESVRLLNSCQDQGRIYYNPGRQCLEHFRFPEIFIRQTKKAYLSFITQEQLSRIGIFDHLPPITYNAIRHACRRRGINMDMHLARKLFASWLYHCNIPESTIDLLQGRVPKSVFARHYLVLKSSLRDDVLQALEKLQQQL